MSGIARFQVVRGMYWRSTRKERGRSAVAKVYRIHKFVTPQEDPLWHINGPMAVAVTALVLSSTAVDQPPKAVAATLERAQVAEGVEGVSKPSQMMLKFRELKGPHSCLDYSAYHATTDLRTMPQCR